MISLPVEHHRRSKKDRSAMRSSVRLMLLIALALSLGVLVPTPAPAQGVPALRFLGFLPLSTTRRLPDVPAGHCLCPSTVKQSLRPSRRTGRRPHLRSPSSIRGYLATTQPCAGIPTIRRRPKNFTRNPAGPDRSRLRFGVARTSPGRLSITRSPKAYARLWEPR